MSEPEDQEPGDVPAGIDPRIARRVGLAAVVILGGAALAFLFLRGSAGPPPPEIAGDPVLVEGRAVYLARCVSCHGETGRGDGPIARGLSGPPVGDLTDGRWKHGDRPDQVLAVVREGVANTSMPGWGRVLSASEVRAVTAYVLHLANRPVPAEWRGGLRRANPAG